MLVGIPFLVAGAVGIYVAGKMPDGEQVAESNRYTELFKNIGILRENEWVKLERIKRNKAYNVFSFTIADSVSIARFQENIDMIAEKINAKDEKVNRLEIYFKDKLMHFRIMHATIEPDSFRVIKPPTYSQLLLGHDIDYLPVWSDDTNLIVCGTTGAGKSTILHTIALNFLANHQGTILFGDIKKTEFFEYTNKKNVVMVCDEMETIESMILVFEKGYKKRIALLREGNKQYKNYMEYNKDHKEKINPCILMIDEFADIALRFKKKDEPIGIYKTLIALAAKIRCVGMRIVLGTQRPSADVVVGILKNNFNLVGMKCINANNSRIVIDEEGLENLEKFRAKIRQEGTLVDVIAYKLTEEDIRKETEKLKSK